MALDADEFVYAVLLHSARRGEALPRRRSRTKSTRPKGVGRWGGGPSDDTPARPQPGTQGSPLPLVPDREEPSAEGVPGKG